MSTLIHIPIIKTNFVHDNHVLDRFGNPGITGRNYGCGLTGNNCFLAKETYEEAMSVS